MIIVVANNDWYLPFLVYVTVFSSIKSYYSVISLSKSRTPIPVLWRKSLVGLE